MKILYIKNEVKLSFGFFNGHLGQIRKGLTTPERPFEFLGKEKFFKIFAFFFILFLRRFSANLNYAFAALSAEHFDSTQCKAPYVPQGKGAARAAPTDSSISLLVSQDIPEWNAIYNYLTRVYHTFEQLQIPVTNGAY